MSTFVLVHGAWQSAGTWDLLAPLLEQSGNSVITPTLSGLGTDQEHLSPGTSLEQHIQDVSRAVSKCPGSVVLVGHSYAGMIISGVAEANPDKIGRLIFLDAFIPNDGQSALDLLPHAVGESFRDLALRHGGGWRLPGGESQLDLWGLKPGESREFVRNRLCDFSLRCFEQPISLPIDQKRSLSATFVSCAAEDYPARPFFNPFAKKARALGWHVVDIQTGHDCHIERPAETAEILLSDRHTR